MGRKALKEEERAQRIGITIDPRIVAEVDRRRGLIPRSTFMQRLLEIALESGEVIR